MKKGTIATLASLAVLATVGPIVGADQQQEHVKTFSDRYLTSLDEADTVAMTGNNNADAIIVDDTRNGHRRLSWWSLVLMARKLFCYSRFFARSLFKAYAHDTIIIFRLFIKSTL